MNIQRYPSLIFIIPCEYSASPLITHHEYSAPPLCCVTPHPSRDVASEVGVMAYKRKWRSFAIALIAGSNCKRILQWCKVAEFDLLIVSLSVKIIFVV